MHHFQCLLQWGHLPLATDAIQPLSASDFIMMVLVPEAATLLIMEDRGWTSAKCKGSAWKDARAVALEVRTDSAEYGRWRFRGESDAGQRIVETLADETRLEGKRARVAEHALALADKRSRKIKRSEHARDPIEIASSDIDISSSDTGSADPSDYGDDDEFWTSAMAVAGSTTPADLADVTPKAKTTKTTATTWPSTTATPTALQPLKRVPSDRTRPFEKGPSMFNANFARTESTESQESWDDGFTADALEQLSKHDAF
jgi:hypothetical protein